jgi:ribosome-binding protein aMBF1 (putative translation factor)
MSPRKQIPDEEPNDIWSRREAQRARKEHARRRRGQPEPSSLASELRITLWLYRLMNHLTQEQLGEQLGMRQPQIARLESGFVEPALETLKRISARTGIDFTIEVRSGDLVARSTRPGSRRA